MVAQNTAETDEQIIDLTELIEKGEVPASDPSEQTRAHAAAEAAAEKEELQEHLRDLNDGAVKADAEIDDLLAQIRRYRGIFAATGGGITFSGGEALAQPAFVRTVARAAHDLGIHVTLDTSGFLGRNCDDELLANLDLVLLDVKAGDELTYHRVTGGRLAPTLDFGRRVAAAGVEVWVRYVLVPGLTDSRATIARVADYAASLATTSRVEVLGFHQFGRDKWAELGLDYQLADTEAPSAAQLAAAREIFASRGLRTY